VAGSPRNHALVLHSLNAVTKESATMSVSLGRASPDPGFGSMVELSRRHASGLFNFIVVGKTLGSSRITAEEPPPPLL